MFVLIRAVTYAAFFIGFVLVYLPARFLAWSGIVRPAVIGAPQVAGMIMVTIGTAIALWCVFTFVFIGKGTPAPFDPPLSRAAPAALDRSLAALPAMSLIPFAPFTRLPSSFDYDVTCLRYTMARQARWRDRQ